MGDYKMRFGLFSPATAAFIKEALATKGFSFFDFLHGYIYGRWTHLYIAIGTGRHPLAKKLAPLADWVESRATRKNVKSGSVESISTADTYHGKALPSQQAKNLVLVNEDINLPDLEQVIPYKRARSIILKNPDHIVALDCPCRSAMPNPCLPLDVCLVVGEPFASFVTSHNPGKTRWITRDEAVAIIDAEDARGHVHHAFFKDAMLGRFYAICNCCSCCCGAIHAHKNGTPMLASSGYVAKVDEDVCVACGNCAEHCQFDALSSSDLLMTVDESKCMGCGVCVDKCPQDAIELFRDETKSAPLEIFALMEKAAAG
jgi:Pyruvate/2-oxoacid:ferredoxin oxidoreductase delta subunit